MRKLASFFTALVLLSVFLIVNCRQSFGATFQPFGDLPGGQFESIPGAVSDDGSTVVGRSNSHDGCEAFRSQNGEMIGLRFLPGRESSSTASGVSADGSVVVGYSRKDPADDAAFIWTLAEGIQGIAQAFDITPDGRVIVGHEVNPDGNREAWIVAIPEPSTLALSALGLGALLAFAGRRQATTGPGNAPDAQSVGPFVLQGQCYYDFKRGGTGAVFTVIR